ncbi:MAG: SRPBCC family protein [Propionibacteriales bacterium]|nr:SRPBCC family protein [Propionibacteriales bacterium]
MAAQTTSSILIAAGPEAIMAVIADFDSYPAWAKGVKSAAVLSEYDGGRAGEVAFVLDAAPIKDEYTLSYDWDGDRQVSWSLVEAKMLKSMEGAYILEPAGDQTEVTYRLAVDLSIPMIGMFKRKGEKVVIDTALKGLKKRVESLDDAPARVSLA